MDALGIDWKILIGQLINFVILFFLLKRFAFKPFFAILEKRRLKIEEGVKKSEEIEKSFQEVRVLSQKIKQEGERKARQVVKETETRAQERAEKLVLFGHEEKDRLLAETQEEIKKEKDRAKKELEKEVAEKVFLVAEKFLKEKIDENRDKKIIEQLVSDAK